MDALGSFFFIVLFLARLDQGLRGNWTAWFLAAQSGLVAFRILFRKRSKKVSPFSIRLLAWFSALAPLSVITPDFISACASGNSSFNMVADRAWRFFFDLAIGSRIGAARTLPDRPSPDVRRRTVVFDWYVRR